MQTLHGIRFMPVARVHGTLLGLDARWLGARGLGMMLVLTLLTLAGPLSVDSPLPLWLRLIVGLSTVCAVVLTSLGHELGHALAGRMAGLRVRAIVIAPQGGVTIRASSDHPQVNFRTALAGPIANALFATGCLALAFLVTPDSLLAAFLNQVGHLGLLTALANLLPFGPMDGTHIVAAWRAFPRVA